LSGNTASASYKEVAPGTAQPPHLRFLYSTVPANATPQALFQAVSMAWEQPEPEKPATRELTLVESPYGFAWGCKACEWFHPLPSFISEGESPIEIVQLAFDEHDCQHYD